MVGPPMTTPHHPSAAGYYALEAEMAGSQMGGGMGAMALPPPPTTADGWHHPGGGSGGMAYASPSPSGYLDPLQQARLTASSPPSTASSSPSLAGGPAAVVPPTGKPRSSARVPVYRTEGEPLRYSAQGRPLTHVCVGALSVRACWLKFRWDSCDICCQAFDRPSALTIHERKHTVRLPSTILLRSLTWPEYPGRTS